MKASPAHSILCMSRSANPTCASGLMNTCAQGLRREFTTQAEQRSRLKERVMSGDYSRFGFVPSQDYSAVLLQQGRALTDRDWNDGVTATNRSLQARTLDTSAPVVVAATTPDAFKITIGGPGGLLIGRGRMYVDGVPAENHGAGQQQWGGVLGELLGPESGSLQPPPLPATASATADRRYERDLPRRLATRSHLHRGS